MKYQWTTADECLWLDKIGQVSEQTCDMDEATLLERYLDSAARRRNWGIIDRQEVLRYARQRRARLRAARGAAA